MSSSKVLLYDIPSKGDHPICWSPNAWKIRLALNYKNIAYDTQWVEYPNISRTLEAAGLQPNATGRPYTIPAIRLPNGEGIAQDSNKIAAILDEIQPSQPLEPANPVTAQAEAVTAKTFAALAPLTLSTMPALMNPVSAESWTAKHEARLGGMSLASLRSSPAATKAWGNAGDGLGQLKVLLGEVANGPFLLGEKPCFADFVIVGAMITLSVADKEVFGRVMDWDESIRRLFEECREWMERVD